MTGERTWCLPNPISLGPLQQIRRVLTRCSSALTTSEQSGTAKTPRKIQPNQCRCLGKRDLRKPTKYAFDDPAWLAGNFEGHLPCGVFVCAFRRNHSPPNATNRDL